jgi:hypothetical protein
MRPSFDPLNWRVYEVPEHSDADVPIHHVVPAATAVESIDVIKITWEPSAFPTLM